MPSAWRWDSCVRTARGPACQWHFEPAPAGESMGGLLGGPPHRRDRRRGGLPGQMFESKTCTLRPHSMVKMSPLSSKSLAMPS